jgi:Entner-Doudoroff aldolase
MVQIVMEIECGKVLERIERTGIIPVAVIEDPSKAVRLGRTLIEAGIDLTEVTMRTKSAIEAIRNSKKGLPEILIDAGTVFSVSKAKEALSAGARFVVSPHLDQEIVTCCIKNDTICIPGGIHSFGG